jgi:hypothetical protein
MDIVVFWSLSVLRSSFPLVSLLVVDFTFSVTDEHVYK